MDWDLKQVFIEGINVDKNVDKNTCKFLIDKIIYTNGDCIFKNVCKLKNWGKGGEDKMR